MKFTRRKNMVILISPGRWALGIGISYRPGTPLIKWESTRWIDKHNIHQHMTTLLMLRRLELTFSRSLRVKASIDAVGRFKRAMQAIRRSSSR